MKYKLCSHDLQHFSTGLHREGDRLKWDSAPGQDVLIIQTVFGEDPMLRKEELCMALEDKTLIPGTYVEILNGVWVCLITAVEKASVGGCKLHGEASRYTVLSYTQQNDEVYLYEPMEGSMNSAHCDISLEVHINVKKEKKITGFIRKREEDTGFYRIEFPEDLQDKYTDNILVYKIDNLEIPITKEMVKQKNIYIKTELRPELVSVNKGLRLI